MFSSESFHKSLFFLLRCNKLDIQNGIVLILKESVRHKLNIIFLIFLQKEKHSRKHYRNAFLIFLLPSSLVWLHIFLLLSFNIFAYCLANLFHHGTHRRSKRLDMHHFVCIGLYWKCTGFSCFFITSFSLLFNICDISINVIYN